MNEKLNITGPADLLATVPHLLGKTPTESFVVLTARGGKLGATLRVDVPMFVEPLNYAQTLTSHAANDEEATASYVIVYADENPSYGYPYADHVATLVNELASARMPVRNVWLVTSSYWAEFGTDEQRPLDQIRDSAAKATLTYFGSTTDIDVYNPALLGRWAMPVEAPEGTFEDFEAACGTWAAVLDAAEIPDAETARALAAAFQHRHIRDYLFRDTITTHNGSFGDVMFGKFTGRPDWDRVDRAEALAFELMKAVPAGQRAPMLTLMGWLEWLKGNGTQADRYLKHAAADIPDFRLAVLLRELINRGSLAEVARDAATSYKRRII
ncbi:hypothetical protein QFZ36_004232 [Pseudarthrobacter siccitolerans]|uniref:DUF4192 family protein n=1 Tax=Pseudarthrobacter siccitolerans TaxID=861266 RepID=A0ABU0PRM7_9MICC|nr:DUF4192 domain-containing protein [Pseudarthrobacter siccitolerans]MDQ0676606.1 hypothetical protein [Pseudarthrobacter siccitolerans]